MRMYTYDQPDVFGGGIFYKEDMFMSVPELKEAFLCGYKKGKEAVEEDYHERNRSGYSNGGSNRSSGYNQRDLGWEEMRRLEEEYHERRRRRANGRFY